MVVVSASVISILSTVGAVWLAVSSFNAVANVPATATSAAPATSIGRTFAQRRMNVTALLLCPAFD
jgi:hypothetical protein